MESAPPDGSPSAGSDPERAEEAWRWCVRAGVASTFLLGYAAASAGIALLRDWAPGQREVTAAALALGLLAAAGCAFAWPSARAAYRRTAVRPPPGGRDGVHPVRVRRGGTGWLGTVADAEVVLGEESLEVRYDPMPYYDRWFLMGVMPSGVPNIPVMAAAMVSAWHWAPVSLLMAPLPFLVASTASTFRLRPRFREIHEWRSIARALVGEHMVVFEGHSGHPVLVLQQGSRAERAALEELFRGRLPWMTPAALHAEEALRLVEEYRRRGA